MPLPCLQPFKGFSLHFRKHKESPAWSGPTTSPTRPPTASYLPCLSHRGLQWVLGTPRNPWAYPTAPPSWKALGTSHLAHRDLNVTPERPHLFDCQLLPTSFLLSMSHNVQLHIYLLIIGLSTDCNLCKGREYIPMYT